MKEYKNNMSKICIMCREKKQDGIMINSGFICNKCEHEIVQTEVEDEKYSFFIQRMKELWLKNA